MSTDLQRRLEQLSRLHKVSVFLAAEEDHETILEAILENAMALSGADGGTLYLLNEDNGLDFVLLRTDSLGIAMGGTTGVPITFPAVPLYNTKTGEGKTIKTWPATQRSSRSPSTSRMPTTRKGLILAERNDLMRAITTAPNPC